jgi:acyl-CoA synthetase (NDP forming)
VGLAILDEATKQGVGIASFVSLGNKADVSGNDLLAAWSDDPAVEAIALYLESFGNPYKFLQLARTCSERKPIVAVFGGSSEAGRRAGLSHTAASLTPWRFLQALCEAAGVIAVSSPQDLVGTASLLLDQPLPAGRRLAIVGNVGGLGIVAADLAQADGLDIASLPTSVETTLGEVDGVAATANPVDLGAAATPELFATAVREVLAVDDVDAVLAIVAATAVTDVEAVLDRFEECAAAAPCTPLLVVVVGTLAARRDPLMFFGAVEDAVAALAGAVSYSSWLGRAKPEQVQEDARIEKLSHRAKVLSASMESTGWIDLQTTFELLDSVNIPLPPWRMITSADEATEAAEPLGYPLVAKACPTGTIHKSDAGLVIAQISDVALLDAAVRELARRAGESETILLQSQASPGVELALGIVQEPDVGPLLMIATGGVNVDVWGDQSFLVPPVSDEQVRRVLRRLRSWPLLQGHRGRPPADIDAFVKLTLRVSDLAVGVPEIKELDLNPVIVGGDGATCVDARIRIGDTSMMMDGMPALSPAMRSRHGRVDGSTDVRRTDAGG